MSLRDYLIYEVHRMRQREIESASERVRNKTKRYGTNENGRMRHRTADTAEEKENSAILSQTAPIVVEENLSL